MPDKLTTIGLQCLGVDREKCQLNGYIVAQCGDFKDKRGAFSMESLQRVCDLMNANPNGVKSHFGHDDQLGKFLGRAMNARIDGQSCRADLCIDKTAMTLSTSGGVPLGEYILSLAESDPGALNSSLVLTAEKKTQVDPVTGKKNFGVPPIWNPLAVFGSDIVTDGDATHGGLLETQENHLRLEARRRRLRLLKLRIRAGNCIR